MGRKPDGSRSRKVRKFMQDPSPLQLPNGSWDPPHLLLHNHHRSCVGTAGRTCPGLALNPGCPALHGWDIMEGGRGEPRADSVPISIQQVFSFIWVCLSVSAQEHCLPRHVEDQTSWLWLVKCYVASGPFSLAFATSHCCSSQAQQSQQYLVSLQARRDGCFSSPHEKLPLVGT